MSSYKTLTLSIENSIATLTFNRPEVLNALSSEVIGEALTAMQSLIEDPAVLVLVLTGAGRAFIAGADIAEMRDKTPDEARTYSELGHRLMNTIQDCPKPVIAAVNGFCLGGGMEVALACDMRMASEKAQFGLPETILGIIPGWGATQRAARLIGPALTKELVFTGEIISAERALQMGLINRLLPPPALMPFCRHMAETMCRQGQIALRNAKKAVDRGLGLPLTEALQFEIDTFIECFDTEDRREGMSAFLEKRRPSFQNR